jgi:1-acyl-sn-glycerol-3-phosphate acyltransferase
VAGFFLWLLGWRVKGEVPQRPKFVAIAAPHTSNWDLIIALLTAIKVRIPIVFMMKRSVFRWPLTLIWRRFGGLPIDRGEHTNIVPMMAEAMKSAMRMALVITPEGTRREVGHWKTGFYWIAREAGVPLLLLWIGKRKRIAGFGPFLELTGDIDADFGRIRAYYEAMEGRPMPNICPPPA